MLVSCEGSWLCGDALMQCLSLVCILRGEIDPQILLAKNTLAHSSDFAGERGGRQRSIKWR